MFTNESLTECFNKSVRHPAIEVRLSGDISDYRLSCGVSCYGPKTVYFLAIYPAFCYTAKAVFHYKSLDELRDDVNTIMGFVDQPEVTACTAERRILVTDIVATVFAISRDKESIELFQEQRDLMELGLKHVHLDNYYQDGIKVICAEYFKTGKLLGSELKLNFLMPQGDKWIK